MQRTHRARPRALERTKAFLREELQKFKLGCDIFFGAEPAFARVPGYETPRSRDLFSPVMYFHTGNAPKKGTPSRKIMDWGYVDIHKPGKKTEKSITYGKARMEVSRLRKGESASHQHIAYEAAKLCSANTEVRKYTLHLVVGALGEDYVFLPKEDLEKLYAEKPKRRFKTRDELGHALGHTEDIPSLASGIMWLASKFAKLFRRKTPDKDSINKPYFAHFYDPRRAKHDQGLNMLNGDLKFQSALKRMKRYWKYASYFYRKGDKPRAFYALGHLTHLIQDLHVPAHVHNDVHGPTVVLGKLDSFEQWCIRADYPSLARPEGRENISIWDSSPLAPPSPDRTWNPKTINRQLTGFTNDVVRYTQGFRSVDAEGTHQKGTGKLSDEECFFQASMLIPRAIENSAQIIMNFLDYHKRYS